MSDTVREGNFFGTEKISHILVKIAPPVMFALLVQALYNIVDSFFVGKYSVDALTALSVIFPVQYIIIAFAVGTGVGVNTYMASKFAQNRRRDAFNAAGTGNVLEIMTWAFFALAALLFMKPYVMTSAKSPQAIADAVTYGNIVCIGSIGSFLEGNWTKVHQSQGHMARPMLAQMSGAAVNIVLDPVFIFGYGPFEEMGVAGAAVATVCGQITAAAITFYGGFYKPPKLNVLFSYAKRIYFYAYSSIVMQATCTVYIIVLNIILAGFSDAAVTVLGLYYKMQSFFFIPLLGLQTCIVPVLSYNYAAAKYDRCTEIMKESLIVSAVFMIIGIIAFVFFPHELISIFSNSPEVHEVGAVAFPIIGVSFISAVFSFMMPVFFQATGDGRKSTLLALSRQIFCLIPSFYILSRIGLNYSWIAFPFSETTAGIIGLILYIKTIRKLTLDK